MGNVCLWLYKASNGCLVVSEITHAILAIKLSLDPLFIPFFHELFQVSSLRCMEALRASILYALRLHARCRLWPVPEEITPPPDLLLWGEKDKWEITWKVKSMVELQTEPSCGTTGTHGMERVWWLFNIEMGRGDAE